MIRKSIIESRRERGGGLVEFCFTIPVLLLIAGATIDLSRYMRFLQITTFVSQETAAEIYSQCSDITIYNPPELGTRTLSINKELTETAVKACIERIQGGAQQLLNSSLGRAAVSSAVFRWNISTPSVNASCGNVQSIGQNVTVILAQASLTATGVSEETKDKIDEGGCNDVGEDDPDPSSSPIRWSSVDIDGDDHDRGRGNDKSRGESEEDESEEDESGESSPSPGDLPSGLTQKGIELRNDGIYQTKTGSSSSPQRLVTASTLCERGRVATVEVSYAFEPIVKLLPHMMIKLNTDGSQRETTVL
jgi:hypothetical protein